jgi:hypothetical protein
LIEFRAGRINRINSSRARLTSSPEIKRRDALNLVLANSKKKDIYGYNKENYAAKGVVSFRFERAIAVGG